VRLPAAVAGGGTRPNVSLVGGPAGLAPLVGVDVRGRSFVLRVNWRNTYCG
jgi:hypothetical protein